MKVSELIAELQKSMAEHGDLPVIVEARYDGQVEASTISTSCLYDGCGAKVLVIE